MSINQFDIFGHEVSEAEMIEKAALERKRYKTMQALYGTKEGFKCKNCKHCECHHYHGRNYYKCALWYVSHSSVTDIRVSATACNRWEGGADMTERERLIEILLDGVTFTDQYGQHARMKAEYMADKLLANGVIVPPCKVGDTVYVLFGEPSRTIKEFRVRTIVFGETNDSIGFTNKSMFTIWDKRWYDFFGKIIFTTREEAEKALEVKT